MSGQFEHIWEDYSLGAVTLAPFGVLYGLGWLAYKAVYDLGFKKPKEPHSPVVCVGSMMAGGAGKTPITRRVAEVILETGREVVIGMSGYRSERRQGAFLAPPGPLSAKVWGDETAVMRTLLPSVPLVVGKDRVLAAELAHEAHPGSVLLMDDGFQHLPIKKHVSILLDSPYQVNRLPIPAGPYREVWSLGKKRADLVLPNDQFQQRQYQPRLLSPEGEDRVYPREVQVLTSIARPYRVVHTLDLMGISVVKGLSLPDHAPLDKPDLLQDFSKGAPVVCTLKDWVKLVERHDLEGWTFLILSHDVTITPEDEFRQWLDQRLSSAKG